jgi:hypothetical protein
MIAGSRSVYVDGAGEPRPALASPAAALPARRPGPRRPAAHQPAGSLAASDDPLNSVRRCVSHAATATVCRSCRPTGFGSTPSGQPESKPTRPSRAWSSTRMASRMAPSIRRSRSVGVISPRSACPRKIAQMCWSASSMVSTVITVPTSTPGVPPRMDGRAGALVLNAGRPYLLPMAKAGDPGRRGRLGDLGVPPGNRLDKLAGDRTGQYSNSIRINRQCTINLGIGQTAADGASEQPTSETGSSRD